MKLVLVLIGVIVLALAGAEAANSYWQATGSACGPADYHHFMSYGGNHYWCLEYGWQTVWYVWR